MGVETSRQESLSFDDDVLHAFAEMFFDASLLWEPGWEYPTPPQPRKTQTLLLPSWSWVRTRGSISTSVWQNFAQNFYKDASSKNIYELQPRVQWWKLSSLGGASKRIKYQHFSNHASMPPGWDPPTFQAGLDRRDDFKYSHTLSPDTEYPHPFPFPESAGARLPDVEYGPLLRRIANRGWLIKSNELRDPYGGEILFDDRLDQSFPQESGERCEVIAIAEGRVPHMEDDYILAEKREIPPEERAWNFIDFRYEFYFILWIGWVDGFAYRRGIGRVLKGVWENMELEEIEVTLG
ncbi:uncharacterized protein Triagg1_9444 [Trichoderma aggressivum f. europaeum]|uniref:Uncharacterized protein n=1 Tax=Trichoderma aggressivum f. europaeum TaxID=173218 RepID=A0AAE1IYR6_9HYPO|nr:hypothetical protein Triagg1_9444 [Trichoderma aggressivum f. europaeum]